MSKQTQRWPGRRVGRLARRAATAARYYFKESLRLYRVSIAAFFLANVVAVAAALMTRRGYAWTTRPFTFLILLELVLYVVCVIFVIRGWFLMGTEEHIREFFSPDTTQPQTESCGASAFRSLTLSESTGKAEGMIFLLISFAVWLTGVWFFVLRRWIADGSIGNRGLSQFLVHLLGAFLAVRAVRVLRAFWDRLLWFRPYRKH